MCTVQDLSTVLLPSADDKNSMASAGATVRPSGSDIYHAVPEDVWYSATYPLIRMADCSVVPGSPCYGI